MARELALKGRKVLLAERGGEVELAREHHIGGHDPAELRAHRQQAPSAA
ncbi:MAG: hypothetical protein MZU91_00165 [Desulfosudis oleivorans]|nr:hypothetical protein [Desulfosudis oleivorans]